MFIWVRHECDKLYFLHSYNMNQENTRQNYPLAYTGIIMREVLKDHYPASDHFQMGCRVRYLPSANTEKDDN